jgi:hypothetical protein
MDESVFEFVSRANEVMHRMSGMHICSRFAWLLMPLIGDLGRSPALSLFREGRQRMCWPKPSAGTNLCRNAGGATLNLRSSVAPPALRHSAAVAFVLDLQSRL